MFKKVLLISMLALMSCNLFAQNLQFHWDFLDERNHPTITFEMFKADKWGDTFIFVDMDFQDFNDPTLGYMEIARNIKLGKLPVMFHAEFNGGLWSSANGVGGAINNAWLVGASYPFAIGKSFFGLTLSYKHIMRTDKKANAQITGTWTVPVWKDKITFTGFADLWSEDKGDGRKGIFIAEPQLWYNFCDHFSLGTEIELSKNFVVGTDKFKVFPTVGAKWNF